ncbi:MAG: hypothetical protein OEM82_10110 [Acidobacteriota bacterium]|nr:hypothetical protein [Acidobacteriota bacterium]
MVIARPGCIYLRNQGLFGFSEGGIADEQVSGDPANGTRLPRSAHARSTSSVTGLEHQQVRTQLPGIHACIPCTARLPSIDEHGGPFIARRVRQADTKTT